MGYLDTGPPRAEYKPNILYQIFQYIEVAVNHLDENNFPNGISGSIILPGTLNGNTVTQGTLYPDAFPDYSVGLNKLAWREYYIPLILLARPVQTTNTEGENLGGYFQWVPSAFPGDGKWYLEASIFTADASATATCILKGSIEYGSVMTTNTSLTLVRSDEITMPVNNESLWIVLKTSNASYAASLVSARIIYVP